MNLYQRKTSPLWYFNVVLPSGKRVRKSTKEPDRKRAEKAAASLHAALLVNGGRDANGKRPITLKRRPGPLRG